MEHIDQRSRRRQWIALILSGCLPGLGQLYLGAWGKGLAFLVVTIGGSWLLGEMVSVDDLLAGTLPFPAVTLALVLALAVVVCWSLWDAWRADGKTRLGH